MPSCWSYFNRLFHYTDLFAHTSMLRYNMESDYSTATGGLLSFTIVVLFASLFFNLGLRTLRKQIINTSSVVSGQIDPSPLTVTLGPGGQMMFGVMISQIDLNASPRLFDIAMTQQFYTSNYTLKNSTNIPLSQCTPQHFAFNQNLANINTQYLLPYALCPPIGQQVVLQGRISSNLSAQLRITVTRCNSSIDSTCLNDSAFAAVQTALGQFQMLLPMVNTLVNPGNPTYKEFYIEDQNIFLFDSTLGSYSYGYIQEDVVQTDQSIMPWKHWHRQNITRTQGPFYSSSYPSSGINFAQVVLLKSSKSAKIERTFYKVDSFLSYVGGLMGTLIFIFYIFRFYSQKCFEVSVARKILVDNQKREVEADSFNFLKYLLTLFKRGFRTFNIELNWPDTQLILESSYEACRQMDSAYIVRKMIYFDAAIARLLEKYEIDSSQFEERPTLAQCQELRKKNIGPEIFRKKEDRDEKKGENEQSFKGSGKELRKNQIEPERNISQELIGSDSKAGYQLNFLSKNNLQQNGDKSSKDRDRDKKDQKSKMIQESSQNEPSIAQKIDKGKKQEAKDGPKKQERAENNNRMKKGER